MRNAGKIVIYVTYALLVFSYFLSCFMRTSSGVVLPNVSLQIELSHSAIGIISGMFFYGYALMQPICGKLCDDKNPLIIEVYGLALFTLGLVLFAVAKNEYVLSAAKFLLGVGASPTFCSLMVFQARVLPPQLFSKFMGFSVLFGHLGGVVSISPLGEAIDILGYKIVHYILAFLAITIMLILYILNYKYLIVRQKKKQQKHNKGALIGFRIISQSRELVILVIIWSITMVLQMNLLGLWGVSWISKECSLLPDLARKCMSLGGMGVLAGACLIGCAGNRLSSSSIYLKGFYVAQMAGLTLLVWGVSFGWRVEMLSVITFLIGMTLGIVNVLCNIFLYKITETEVVGTVLGACNVILFMSVLLSQWLSGVLIQTWSEMTFFTNVSAISVFFALVVVCGMLVLYPLYNCSYNSYDMKA